MGSSIALALTLDLFLNLNPSLVRSGLHRDEIKKKIRIKIKNPKNRESAHAEGNALDGLAAEAVLEAFEDFLALVADDLAEPDVVVHGDEQLDVRQRRHGAGWRCP